MNDKTIRELQSSLPWTVHYHRDFRANPQSHKDFQHALLHIMKAAGKLAAYVNDAEHGGYDFPHAEVGPYVADMVVCALRMANTCPNGVIDLQRAVEDRIRTKNATAQTEAAPGAAQKFYTHYALFCRSCSWRGYANNLESARKVADEHWQALLPTMHYVCMEMR